MRSWWTRNLEAAGDAMVIEEFMTGPEVSVLSFAMAKLRNPWFQPRTISGLYLDNDEGVNTGGMGTFSPSRIYAGDTGICGGAYF
ncbi:MAG: hypothetical protein ACLR23_00040 [Clostridia bacterium]